VSEQPPATRDMFGASGFGDTSGFSGLVVQPPQAASSPRPYGEWFDEAADALAQAYPAFGEAVERVVVHRGELTLYVKRESLLDVLSVLRDDPQLRFEMLAGVSGVDYLDDPTGRRLHAVYHLLSMTFRRRLRLEVSVSVDDPHVPSATAIYPTANWHERETWDFFGIIFDGHPALTRIEMPDDWPGHPQRKDYPLGGVPVEYKGAQIPPPDTRRSYA
jgi:NADH-quinone oxidoreductase subunit C